MQHDRAVNQLPQSIYRQLCIISYYYKSEVSKLMRKTSAEMHLSGTAQYSQFHIMLELHDSGPLTLTEISETIGTSRPNVTTAVKGLYKLKLVNRSDDPTDKRKVLVSETDLDAEFCDRIIPQCYDLYTLLYGNMDEARDLLGRLTSITDRIQANLDTTERKRIMGTLM